ncbi:MAG TPA: hypothetical protein VJ461_05585 [Candidatus Nanoarchaeia archaeon]|nr:hypothetical protein [Candidatus Nanoarchaeia archaeon]
MMLIHPVKDFLNAASKHARAARLKELNYLEAEVIMAEEMLLGLRNEGMPSEAVYSFENKIDDLKKIIKNKKSEVLPTS